MNRGRVRMVRSHGANEGQKREAWTAQEDKILAAFIGAHGEGKWINIPKQTGLKRRGRACRLRWMNYLRPDIKRGNITEDEQDLILRLHKLLGNRWSLIAGRLPGRTANEIKNYWNTKLAKREKEKQSNSNDNNKWENWKRAINEEAGVQWHDHEETSEHMVLHALTPLERRIDDCDDSDVATVESDSVPVDVQSSPYAEDNLDEFAFLEFLDLDFTQLPDCDVFNKSNSGLTQEEGSNTDSTRGHGNATKSHICETPEPRYSGQTIWNASACFGNSSHSDLGSWGDFLDSAQEM